MQEPARHAFPTELGGLLRAGGYCFLERLSGRESRNSRCRDLDRLARLRIAPVTRGARRTLEGAETRHRNVASGCNRALDDLDACVYRTLGICLREISLGGDCRNQFGFVQLPAPRVGLDGSRLPPAAATIKRPGFSVPVIAGNIRHPRAPFAASRRRCASG